MNNDKRADFYRERDKRTTSFIDNTHYLNKKIGIVISKDASTSKTGQLLILTLINQLCRVHRDIEFILECDHDLILDDYPFVSKNALSNVILQLTHLIDPFGKYALVNSLSVGALTLSVGNSSIPTTYYTGSRGTVAILHDGIIPNLDWSEGSKIASGFSACLSAAALFRMAANLHTRPLSICVWDLEEVDFDHENFHSETLETPMLGSSLVIGAGAVGSAFVYWLRLLGFHGELTVIDKDPVELHNTNRSPLFLPSHTNWFGTQQMNKVDILGGILKGKHRLIPLWYDEVDEIRNDRFDIIFCLANERDVRTRILNRYPLITLHATTGHEWLSQVHRHIYGIDDCIRCRMHDFKEISFECSTVEIEQNEDSNNNRDAALPFLSLASALLLYVSTIKITTGSLVNETSNDSRLFFDFLPKPVKKGRQKCQQNCSYSGRNVIVQTVNSENILKDMVQPILQPIS